jgi:hypothetical protein
MRTAENTNSRPLVNRAKKEGRTTDVGPSPPLSHPSAQKGHSPQLALSDASVRVNTPSMRLCTQVGADGAVAATALTVIVAGAAIRSARSAGAVGLASGDIADP